MISIAFVTQETKLSPINPKLFVFSFILTQNVSLIGLGVTFGALRFKITKKIQKNKHIISSNRFYFLYFDICLC